MRRRKVLVCYATQVPNRIHFRNHDLIGTSDGLYKSSANFYTHSGLERRFTDSTVELRVAPAISQRKL
jgi:hypothetical protein